MSSHIVRQPISAFHSFPRFIDRCQLAIHSICLNQAFEDSAKLIHEALRELPSRLKARESFVAKFVLLDILQAMNEDSSSACQHNSAFLAKIAEASPHRRQLSRSVEQLLDLISQASRNRCSGRTRKLENEHRPDCPSHPAVVPSAVRCAHAIVKVIEAREDPRKLATWGHLVGASASTLKNWCAAAGFSARHALLLARLLRAVEQCPRAGVRPTQLLDIVEKRTMVKMMGLAGLKDGTWPNTAYDLLSRQTLILDKATIDETRRLLRLRQYPH